VGLTRNPLVLCKGIPHCVRNDGGGGKKIIVQTKNHLESRFSGLKDEQDFFQHFPVKVLVSGFKPNKQINK